mgnify:FL=1|jgi:hypothetical protein
MSVESELSSISSKLQSMNRSLDKPFDEMRRKRRHEENKELLKNQTKILDNTNKLYVLLVLLTFMTLIFSGLSTILNNLSWYYNPILKKFVFTIFAFFTISLPIIFVFWIKTTFSKNKK